MRSLITLIFLTVMTISHSQDEFLIENNGLMVSRSFAFYSDNNEQQATGIGIKINRMVLGAAFSDDNTSFSLLYNAIVTESKPDFKQILQLGASLSSVEHVNMFGGHISYTHILPLINNAPSSIQTAVSIYHYKRRDYAWNRSVNESSITTPTISFGMKQAILSHLFIYPVFGASYTFTEYENFTMFAVGINVKLN